MITDEFIPSQITQMNGMPRKMKVRFFQQVTVKLGKRKPFIKAYDGEYLWKYAISIKRPVASKNTTRAVSTRTN